MAAEFRPWMHDGKEGCRIWARSVLIAQLPIGYSFFPDLAGGGEEVDSSLSRQYEPMGLIVAWGRVESVINTAVSGVLGYEVMTRALPQLAIIRDPICARLRVK